VDEVLNVRLLLARIGHFTNRAGAAGARQPRSRQSIRYRCGNRHQARTGASGRLEVYEVSKSAIDLAQLQALGGDGADALAHAVAGDRGQRLVVGAVEVGLGILLGSVVEERVREGSDDGPVGERDRRDEEVVFAARLVA